MILIDFHTIILNFNKNSSSETESIHSISKCFDDQIQVFEDLAKSATLRFSALISMDFTQEMCRTLFTPEWEEKSSMVETLDFTLRGM
jgi:hypothetical protein